MDKAIPLVKRNSLRVQERTTGSASLDKIAFEELYNEYLPRVYNYVCYRVGDEKTAEDITAEIFERALKHLHTYRADRGAFSTWLFKIARNLISNHLRSRRRRPETYSLDAYPAIDFSGVSPEQAAIEAERMRQVQKMMGRLPEREQEILALKFGFGLGNGEIAKVLRLNPNHVGVLLHRALRELRLSLEQV
jgi:RNA polymerase sigma factor (sigma-70 family)